MTKTICRLRCILFTLLLVGTVGGVTVCAPKKISDPKTIRIQNVSVNMQFEECVALKGLPSSKKVLDNEYEVTWADGVSAMFLSSNHKSVQVFGNSLEVSGYLVAKRGISVDSLTSRSKAIGLGEPALNRPFGVSKSERGKPLSEILYHTAELRVAGAFIEFRFSHNRLEHVLLSIKR